MKSLLVSILLIISGCSNPSIVKLSPDTYMLYREDHAGIFGSSSSLRAGVIRDANNFAEKHGKVAIPISSNFKPMGNGPAQWASFEYQFKVIDKNDPEARRTSLSPQANIVIDKKEKISAEITTKDETKKSTDVYSELIKLDELRKKGILTETEFEAQKKKILSRQ